MKRRKFIALSAGAVTVAAAPAALLAGTPPTAWDSIVEAQRMMDAAEVPIDSMDADELASRLVADMELDFANFMSKNSGM